MREMHRHSPEHVPEVYLHDETMSLVAMQYLAPPHVIMRHGILSGHVYSQVAAQLADLLACTLFRTSLLAMPADTFRKKAAMYVNGEMCELTEQVRPRSVSTSGCGNVLCVGVTIVVSLAMSSAHSEHSTTGCGSVLCVRVTIVVSLAMSTACAASMH